MQEQESPGWLDIAKAEIGVREVKGPQANLRIIEYHKFTMLQGTSDEIPWCSAFVNYCMIKAGLKGTRSAAARSWLNWGSILKAPQEGCVVVFERGNTEWQGHVGFYVREGRPGFIQVLGGNQGDAVSVEEFSKSKILGYRWPETIKEKKK